LVAAGVAEYSTFAADPLARLRRTLDATLAMVFGTTDEAKLAAAKINSVHASVHGTLPEAAGRYPAGTRFDATDPELLVWVQATLVDTTFEVYGRFVRPLSADELEVAYEESKTVSELLGVPSGSMPPDVASFRRYMDEMLASDKIGVAAFQRRLARDVLYPSLKFVPRAAMWPAVALTTALLPKRVREEFALELSAGARHLAGWAERITRNLLPVMPAVLREMPQARRAEKRVRGSAI
jgi:uncharacterized protein (DUF2236 family)